MHNVTLFFSSELCASLHEDVARKRTRRYLRGETARQEITARNYICIQLRPHPLSLVLFCFSLCTHNQNERGNTDRPACRTLVAASHAVLGAGGSSCW